MTTLADLLAVDTPEQRRADALAEADYLLLSNLIRLRKERGLSQQDVADALGITQPAVAAFERHDADPKLSTIRRYAHAIGVLVGHVVEPDHGQAHDGELHTIMVSVRTRVSPSDQAAQGSSDRQYVHKTGSVIGLGLAA